MKKTVLLLIFLLLATAVSAYPSVTVTTKDYYGEIEPNAVLFVTSDTSGIPLDVFTANSDGIATMNMVPGNYYLKKQCTVPDSPVTTYIVKPLTIEDSDVNTDISCHTSNDYAQQISLTVTKDGAPLTSGLVSLYTQIGNYYNNGLHNVDGSLVNDLQVIITPGTNIIKLFEKINDNNVVLDQEVTLSDNLNVNFMGSVASGSLELTLIFDNVPQSDKSVTIHRDGSFFTSLKTDANGFFSLALDPATYTLIGGGCTDPDGDLVTISKSYVVTTFPIVETITCDFSSSIEVTLTDGTNILPGKSVMAVPSGRSKTTDENGVATFYLSPGDYSFRTWVGGDTQESEIISVPATPTYTFEIPPTTGTITARVTDGTNPIPSRSVMFKDTSNPTAIGFKTDAYATTDENGVAVAQLYDGTYDIQVQCPESTQVVQGTTVAGDNQDVAITCDGINIQTRIIYSDGSLVPVANLNIIPDGWEDVVGLERFNTNVLSTSQNPGTFSLSPGAYRIEAVVHDECDVASKYYFYDTNNGVNNVVFDFVFDKTKCELAEESITYTIPQSTSVTAPDINVSFGVLFAAVVLLSILGTFVQQRNSTKR